MTRMCSLKSMGKEMVILIEQTYSFDNTSWTKDGKTNLTKEHRLKSNLIIISNISKPTKKLMKKMKIEILKWINLNKSITSGLKRRIAPI
jgi:hypothetical protein